MIYSILHILFILLFVYLSVIIIYLFFCSIAGHLKKKLSLAEKYSTEKKNIAVLITSYKEDQVIVQTVTSAVQHDYPSSNFHVFVAADHLLPSTIAKLRQLNATVYEVQFPVGSKARSLNYLLNNIDEEKFDIALIVDGDNILQQRFLEQVNAAFQNRSVALQAHRTAKNLNTPVAILDALSEEVNNHIFRRAQNVMGFSASLIGSGMAFPFKELKRVYNKPGILDNPACDREVDFEMLRSGLKIEFLDKAFIFDEKVPTKNIFENQRRRWLESQLIHLKMFFSSASKAIPKTKDFWNKLFITLIPPRLLILAVFAMVFIAYLIQHFAQAPITGMPLFLWFCLLALYIISILIAIPRRLLNVHLLKAFLHLPVLALSLIKATLTIRPGRKEFVHTPKSFTGNSGTTDN